MPDSHQDVSGNYNATASGSGTAIVNIWPQVKPATVDEAVLQDAVATLDALPTGAPPPIAPLPPCSCLSYGPNPLFVGRQPDLTRLAIALKPHLSAAVIHGLPGVGKTQLAIEFVQRYGPYFAGGVFWLSFAEPAGIPSEIVRCGGAAGMDLLPGFDALAIDEQVRRVLSAWQSPLPRLLVFDNCEDEKLLDAWRPPAGGCRVFVTTRRAGWDPTLGVESLALGVLKRDESVALLRKYKISDDPSLDAIADYLGDLPLALHMAGSYLKRYEHSVTPAQYLRDIQQPDLLKHRSLTVAGRSPTGHELHVARTFAVSYDRLVVGDPIDDLARRLLARAAYFMPGEPIPRGLLLKALPTLVVSETTKVGSAELDSTKTTKVESVAATTRVDSAADAAKSSEFSENSELYCEDALHRLSDLGLLETAEGGALRLHRLVVAFVLDVLPDADAQEDVEKSIIAEAYRLNMAGDPRALQAWQLHLRHVTEAALSRKDNQAATLATNLGYHLQQAGDLAGARPYCERALAISEEVLGPTHPDTAGSLNNLGMLLKAQGDLAGARPYLERALAVCEEVLGPTHPDTAGSFNNLGMLLKAQGDLAGARPYLERALAVCEEVLGPTHPDTATSLNNLGALLDALGDLAGARPYYERALAIREVVLGPTHPDTAQSLNNLGYLQRALGELAGARPYYERALAICEEVLGPTHPNTAPSLNNMGSLLQAQGDLAGARPYYERALAIWEAVLGPTHPDTAQSLNNLGGLLYAMGDLAGARPYLERALAIWEAVLGPTHPDTARSLNDLGGLLYALGDLAGARLYLERALAIFEERLGPDHPNTRTVRHNLEALGDAPQ